MVVINVTPEHLSEATQSIKDGGSPTTKQEELREGLEHVITVNHPYIASKITEKVIAYLHSKGVVIKVDEPFRIAQSINGDSLVAVEELLED